MLNPKKRIRLENKHMATFFFMFAIVFFGFFVWNRYTWNIIMFFFCFILSMSFKTWALIREVDNGLNILIERKVL